MVRAMPICHQRLCVLKITHTRSALPRTDEPSSVGCVRKPALKVKHLQSKQQGTQQRFVFLVQHPSLPPPPNKKNTKKSPPRPDPPGIKFDSARTEWSEVETRGTRGASDVAVEVQGVRESQQHRADMTGHVVGVMPIWLLALADLWLVGVLLVPLYSGYVCVGPALAELS